MIQSNYYPLIYLTGKLLSPLPALHCLSPSVRPSGQVGSSGSGADGRRLSRSLSPMQPRRWPPLSRLVAADSNRRMKNFPVRPSVRRAVRTSMRLLGVVSPKPKCRVSHLPVDSSWVDFDKDIISFCSLHESLCQPDQVHNELGSLSSFEEILQKAN